MPTKKKLPLVVVFGRTNVGKSTIFNRLAEEKKALISAVPGTTRDSNISVVKWQGHKFEIIDLAGWESGFGDKISESKQIQVGLKAQADMYLKKASLILFVVDNQSGLLPQDKELAKSLQTNTKLKRKTMLVVNKVDNFKYAPEAAQFNKLGLGEPRLLSALTGSGSGDLLDHVIEVVKAPKEQDVNTDEEDDSFKVCILGKPNVGKSSLLNKMLGYQRVIVSSTPHTTREPQDTHINYKGQELTLIDTAGVNKKYAKLPILSRSSIKKTMLTLRRSDLVLLVLDINDGLTHQDSKLVEEILEAQKSLIIVANKWDLIDEKETKKQTEMIYSHLPFITWVPIHFISCAPKDKEVVKKTDQDGELIDEEFTSRKIQALLDLILKVHKERKSEIPKEELYDFMLKTVRKHPPTKAKGYKRPHIKVITQVGINPPKFEILIGPNDTLQISYQRFVENQMRKYFGFTGTPIKTMLKHK